LFRTILRVVGNGVIVVGLLLLVRVLYKSVTGSLLPQFFVPRQSLWVGNLYALGLSLPIPFHVISIGLVLHRKWLSPPWSRIAWVAVVLSGFWLGVALGFRVLGGSL